MAEVVAAAFGGDGQHHSGPPRRLGRLAPMRPARVGDDRKRRADLAFQVVPGDKSKNESDKLKIAMSKDELKQAAAFEAYKAPSSTVGMGSPGTTRPAGTPPSPR